MVYEDLLKHILRTQGLVEIKDWMKHILRTFAFVTWDVRTIGLEAHFGDKLYRVVALSYLIHVRNPFSYGGLSSNARHRKDKNLKGSTFPFFNLVEKCRRIS